MPIVDVPDGRDPLAVVWADLAPQVSAPAAAFNRAAYDRSQLPLRVLEAARVQLARINECQLCLGWRSARDVARYADDPSAPDEEFYAHVGVDPSWSGFDERERLAADFADRYAVDHLSMDAAYWATMRAHFDDAEIVELAFCVAAWLGLGRLNRVLDVDGACRIPGTSPDGS